MTRSRALITLGIMLSLFLAAMESTVVATAMPTIVSQLGGLASYSWVFTAYILASTTAVPIYGKLSDVYGRRPAYAAAMALFLVGSLLCGLAQSMPQLIAARALQGLGAGGLLVLAFVIVGAMYSFEQRARMQGLFSGVWGVSSIIGPLLGGFLVDQASWRWVFYINLVPGSLAVALIWALWVDEARAPGAAAPQVDYLGAGLLTAGGIAAARAVRAGRQSGRCPAGSRASAGPGRRALRHPGGRGAAGPRPRAAAAAVPPAPVRRRVRPRDLRRVRGLRQRGLRAAVRAGGARHQRDRGGRHPHSADAGLGLCQHHGQPAPAARRLPLGRSRRHDPADARDPADVAHQRARQPAQPAGRPDADGHRDGPVGAVAADRGTDLGAARSAPRPRRCSSAAASVGRSA